MKGPGAPVRQLPRSKECISIPLAHASVSGFQDGSAVARGDGVFAVRAASDHTLGVLLRAGSAAEARAWVRALLLARDALSVPALRKPAAPKGFTGQLARLGRVHERAPDGAWQDFFMALTDFDLAFYSTPPVRARTAAMTSLTRRRIAQRI